RAGVDAGRLNGATKLRGASLFFQPSASQKAALESLLAEQQNPDSPNYHRWITPQEYADRFGMTVDDINKVTSWLKSQGLTIDRVSPARNRVSFTGTVAQIEAAFRTEFHNYVVNGEKHFANSKEFSVPAAFAGTVLGFHNVNDFRLKPRVLK